MGRVKRFWYLSLMWAAKFQASLRIRAVSPEPPLLAHTSSESRGTFRQKARSLAPLNGWACAVKICHDGMLEDTNSLDSAQIIHVLSLRWSQRKDMQVQIDNSVSRRWLLGSCCRTVTVTLVIKFSCASQTYKILIKCKRPPSLYTNLFHLPDDVNHRGDIKIKKEKIAAADVYLSRSTTKPTKWL